MEVKYCLIIDDQDQSATLRSMKNTLRSDHGIDLIYDQVNPSHAKNQSFEPDGTPFADIEKIKAAISAVTFFKRADAIACDYNLVKGLNGFEVLIALRELGYKAKKEIVLYSANIDTAIEHILLATDADEKRDKLRKLVEANVHFEKRDYQTKVTELIKKELKFEFESEIAKWLHSHKESVFLSTFPKFQGKKFEDIAKEIENDTPDSVEFKRELVQQIISIQIDLNDLGQS